MQLAIMLLDAWERTARHQQWLGSNQLHDHGKAPFRLLVLLHLRLVAVPHHMTVHVFCVCGYLQHQNCWWPANSLISRRRSATRPTPHSRQASACTLICHQSNHHDSNPKCPAGAKSRISMQMHMRKHAHAHACAHMPSMHTHAEHVHGFHPHPRACTQIACARAPAHVHL